MLANLAAAEGPLRANVWHQLTPQSPLYSRVLDGYQGAALVQSDGVAAILVLGNETKGAVVTLRLPGWDSATSLVSELEMPGGYVLDRPVGQEQLTAHPSEDNDALDISFAVTHEDLPLFRKALRWRVRDGNRVVTVTLKGSSKAIQAAMDAQSAI